MRKRLRATSNARYKTRVVLAKNDTTFCKDGCVRRRSPRLGFFRNHPSNHRALLELMRGLHRKESLEAVLKSVVRISSARRSPRGSGGGGGGVSPFAL